ncbi:MAG: dihydrodipicolinate reductase [Cypionkella sp.]
MLRLITLMLLTALPGQALAFEPIKDRDSFVDMVTGRQLQIGMYSLSLSIGPEGTISGKALGSEVRGTWNWQDGYFCRDIFWSTFEIPHNCQLVEAREGKMRFTSDKGAGMSAAFTLK